MARYECSNGGGGGGGSVGEITFYQANFTNHSTTYSITKPLKVLIAQVVSGGDYRTAPNLNGSTPTETFRTTSVSGGIFRDVPSGSTFKIEFSTGTNFSTILIMEE